MIEVILLIYWRRTFMNNQLIGGYDSIEELTEALSSAKDNGYNSRKLVIVSKDGSNIEALAETYGAIAKIIGSQELGNQRFLDSAKALFLGADPGTSSGIHSNDEYASYGAADKDAEEFAQRVFDGQYVLFVDNTIEEDELLRPSHEGNQLGDTPGDEPSARREEY
ncbi:hypothetical protein FZD47_05280 [Bacillus infantis]|uniref:General stress protein 17M-like domain-containing protein n=2 Tax=Bacillaceae TaxID=186817 RepID=A0A5D4SN06_9BACI|nr:hypothetical protein FZD47_05280 [Bacillus infantis]